MDEAGYSVAFCYDDTLAVAPEAMIISALVPVNLNSQHYCLKNFKAQPHLSFSVVTTGVNTYLTHQS